MSKRKKEYAVDVLKREIEARKTKLKPCPFCNGEADAIDLGVSALNKHYKEQIQRLKKQVFTREELNTIIDALQIAKEEFAFCPEEKAFDEILKKIEQSLKNSEANLKNERLKQ